MPAGLVPVLRGFGAMTLGFGGLTSFYGARAADCQRVDYVVRGEIAFLAMQTLVFLLPALNGIGPARRNWAFAAASAVMLALFAGAFAARPRGRPNGLTMWAKADRMSWTRRRAC